MKKIIFIFLFVFLSFSRLAYAQEKPQASISTYEKATVIQILKEGEKNITGSKTIFQDIRVRFLEGEMKGKEIVINYGSTSIILPSQKVNKGDTLIVATTKDKAGKDIHTVADTYRLPRVIIILIGFMILIVAFAGRKGIGSILGLFISLGVIIWFIVPMIMSGHDPLFISLVGALFIIFSTMYLAHGFTQRTSIAVASTVLSLLLTGALATLFVSLSHLSGLGSEDIYSLSQGFSSKINFHGLLLGGIIIGALGVLDDVTTTQAATIYNLAETDKKLTSMQLFKRGMDVGKEHITSVVNTLVLAYAGASIGVFIFLIFATKNQIQPLWVILNSETITEEIIRALSGSVGLVLAVPLTTLFAAFASRYSISIK